MHRKNLLNALDEYQRNWVTGLKSPYASFDANEEASHLNRLRQFVLENPNCFERSLLSGHVTGSAFIVDRSLTQVLLTLHRKLGKWLQLGGHSDGDPLTHAVAIREAREESGLDQFEFYPLAAALKSTSRQPLIFDLDIHVIPARQSEPEHFHFDIRYLLIASIEKAPTINEESTDLAWHPLENATLLNDERSMQRQFHKLNFLRTHSPRP